MEMDNWIWASVWLAELGWATRLWQLGLARNYPFLTTYLVFSALHSIASFLALHAWGLNSHAFGWLWMTTQPVLWTLLFCVVMEGYNRMLSPYEGLRRLGELGTYGALGAVSVVILGMIILDPVGDGTPSVGLRFWMHQQRSVFLALAVVSALLAFVGAYCRLTLPRNVLVLFSVFGLIFVTQAVLATFRNHLGPAFGEMKNLLSASFYIAFVLVGTFGFSLAGEKCPEGAEEGWSADAATATARVVTRRLQDVNELLLRVLRS